MKLIDCPYLGPRPVQEFTYGGVMRPMPDPSACDDARWASYVFERDASPGVAREWWYHRPSGAWLIAERDTRADEIVATYPYADPRATDPSAVSDRPHPPEPERDA